MTGLFGIVIAPFISRLLRFFPTVITGSVITVVLAVILVLLRSGSGVVRNTAVLAGIVVNYGLTLVTGTGSLNGIETQPWFNMAVPVQFGIPSFDLVACVSMCLVMMVVMIERSGMFLTLGVMVGRPVRQQDLARGLRADGVGKLIGGTFNTAPYTSSPQKIGLTGVSSPMVWVVGGVMFGMAAATRVFAPSALSIAKRAVVTSLSSRSPSVPA